MLYRWALPLGMGLQPLYQMLLRHYLPAVMVACAIIPGKDYKKLDKRAPTYDDYGY